MGVWAVTSSVPSAGSPSALLVVTATAAVAAASDAASLDAADFSVSILPSTASA